MLFAGDGIQDFGPNKKACFLPKEVRITKSAPEQKSMLFYGGMTRILAHIKACFFGPYGRIAIFTRKQKSMLFLGGKQ